jgi:hypothetical protein
MFPLSVAGQLNLDRVPSGYVTELFERLESALVKNGATITDRRVNVLTVRAPSSFFVSHWNVLAGFDQCELWIDTEAPMILNYSFSTRGWVFSVTVALMLISAYHFYLSPHLHVFGILFPIVTWLWVIGGNYLILRFRLAAFLKRAAVAF